MGIDGTQYLEIRGAQYILDDLEKSGIVFEGGDPQIAAGCFGSVAEITHRSRRRLVVRYIFRNQPVYEYLTQLLTAYPTIWIKNNYITENGDCGLWIGRTVDGHPSIQDLVWKELMIEELQLENFSIQEYCRSRSPAQAKTMFRG